MAYDAEQEQSKLGKLGKVNDFLNNNPWGNVVTSGIDLVGGLIKLPPGYSGKYGGLLQGIDKTWDTAASTIMKVPGWGTVAGVAMKGLGLLNKGIQALGGGTDGMTKTDAWLSSSLLGWTPLGMINGFGGKKAHTYTRNTQLDALSSAGFGGFLALQNTTQVGAGKKYGLFSSGAREKQDRLTLYTQGIKHTISGIVDTNTINNLAALTTSPIAAARFLTDINGGFLNLRAARKGMKVPKPYLFKQPKYNPFKATLGEEWQDVHDPYGVETAIPSTLSTAQRQGIAPIPTKRGTIVYMGLDGKLQNKPVSYSMKKGGFILNVIKKYQQGSLLKRSFKTVDIATGKYVEIPFGLTKEQLNGKAPIRLANGTAVFMLKDGRVDSGRWETPGARQHLTPKGLNGMKIPSLDDFIAAKIKERTEQAIKKATTRTKPYMFKNKNWKNCIATAFDSYGLYDDRGLPLVIRNADLERDPQLYGFEEVLFGDNVDTLPEGVLILDYNKPRNPKAPGHTIMLVGRTETFAPIYSYSSGDNTPSSMHNNATRYSFVWNSKIKPRAYRYIGTPDERKAWEEEYNTLYGTPRHKNGGQMNVIPEGALHARKNHLTEIDDMYKAVTHKGIPVITIEEGGEVVQHAEVEHSEIIFTKEVTDKMEEYRKQGTDEAALECGKMLVKEILYNTDDRSGVIQTVE